MSMRFAVADTYFNPRSREGSDPLRAGAFVRREFQSTLPRRERPATMLIKSGADLFQSTLPRRERHIRDTQERTFRVFQSTLP